LNINKYFKESIIKSLIICRFGKSYFKILKDGNVKIVVLTKFHQDFLQQIGINREKIYLSPNNVEIQNTSYSKNNDKYVVYAGRISTEKGVEDLIESFLRSKLDGFKLKILGDGPDFRRLNRKI
jgi:glycosyltransferase involved in cell wall biosynthesis